LTTFRPPILKLTLLGICLGAIPQTGNWGSANWTVPWAGQVGGAEAPGLKADTQFYKSLGGAVGALLGGWIASRFGRRSTYFVISLVSLCISFYIFRYSSPRDPLFLWLVFGIGFSGTLYFGWLPLFLPELFPTHIRATGSGVSFNFGRILTAFGVLGTGQLMRLFEGDYARVGQLTCLVYVLGMLVILFAPDTSKSQL
jgi:cyanate permease